MRMFLLASGGFLGLVLLGALPESASAQPHDTHAPKLEVHRGATPDVKDLAKGGPGAHDDDHGVGGHGDGHGKGDGPLSIAADLGIWTLVIFVLLMLILRKLAWKPMLEGLQKREATIRNALEEAERARVEAQRVRADLQKQLDQAGERVRGILDEARRDAQRSTDELIAKARQEIQTERDRLHREMAIARDQALQEIWSQAADLATLISAKTIRRNLTPEDHRRLIDDALADLRTVGEGRAKQLERVL